jgi:hypothetical protein
MENLRPTGKVRVIKSLGLRRKLIVGMTVLEIIYLLT